VQYVIHISPYQPDMTSIPFKSRKAGNYSLTLSAQTPFTCHTSTAHLLENGKGT